ncbi:sensor histidine kinase [Pedobacter nyackensis]|uniref:Histidine kinase-, DNA gyrase B-, and HSP90-like ATPase n=1 Tax=Pedobacter nyackensis TaxID=475255 RepID=A0A1W2DKA9_9SPHI|nr:histidine kinase [Pedobacter nyackensis]SMC97867.1 Histidine kinase-, DNA gyrase B-, and HSP90-like ATPase [Pedobacter nyackensis]
MKIILSILTLSLLFIICKAQQKYAIIDEYGQPASYGVSALASKIPVYLATDKNTKSIDPFNPIPNDPLGTIVFLDRATTISVTTRLKKDSLNYYRYTVIENDTTIIKSNAKLTQVDQVWLERSDLPGHLTMNFGISNVVNKKVTIKIYRIPEEKEVTTVIVYNKPLQHARILGTKLHFEIPSIKIGNQIIPWDKISPLRNDTAFEVNHKTRGISLLMQKTDLDFRYHVVLINKINGKDNIAYLSNNWRYNNYDGNPGNFIPSSYFMTPGAYKLIVAPVISDFNLKTIDDKSFKISFTVLPPPRTYSLQEMITGLFGLILIAAITICLIRENNSKKLSLAKNQAETANTELLNVRSRLNPHFVFNALGGIQNLINKNEIEPANEYLSKFARLTRHILNDETKISIKDEIDLLEDYLSMEQLRFPFKYEIHSDPELNSYTEIPSMLIQPFVENAVKHAIPLLKEKGKITINFNKEGQNLIITIADNGSGFNTIEEYAGLGLKLSKKRISLLNDIYKECPISLDIDSGRSGTNIKITLSQWL